MSIVEVIMFALLICVSDQQNLPTEETKHCGQYGFRCIDTESFQICTYPDLDGVTDAPEVVHKCFDHNVCDEDNPAYCTPLDPVTPEIKVKSNGKCQKKIFAKREQPDKFLLWNDASKDINKRKEALRDSRFGNKLDTRDAFDFNNEDETEPTTTTESDPDCPTLNYHQFECENFGYFPDVDNSSMFWHCDHQNKGNGKGYIVRHMLCSKGRVFHPVHKECVMIGTTRNIRNEFGRDYVTLLKHQDYFEKKRKPSKSRADEFHFHYKFSCRNRLPGKYPDELDCRIYHYCLPRRFATFREITFLCPDHLTYDDEEGTCNDISFHRCNERVLPHPSKKLHIEIDAIVLQKRKCKFDPRRDEPADCSEYHLCYNDVEVHLKCPDSYRFNENLLTCQPQQLVACEYE